ncbi:peptidoglycan-binding LysM domain protein [Apiospora aurea]|uniref:Peptidoglycan-binding LysM domain protein n=1 Tax=Apiospora aurea TaxID=335848 RepID=A0ABR1PW81_9PEZI
MGRWSQYETDEERLPEGMVRIGYDADDQTYTFKDTSDGSIWESAPGSQYGRLTRISGPSSSASPPTSRPNESYSDGDAPPPPYAYDEHAEPDDSWSGNQKISWRADMMPLLNFFTIIGLFLLGVFWFLHKTVGSGSGNEGACAPGARTYSVKQGDTCWDIANRKALEVDDILRENKGLDCDNLEIGDLICVPTTS